MDKLHHSEFYSRKCPQHSPGFGKYAREATGLRYYISFVIVKVSRKEIKRKTTLRLDTGETKS